MLNVSTAYEDLLRDVYENGVPKTDRTGVGTRSVFGRQIRFNLEDGFPLITTKKVFTKAVFAELLWFLKGSTNVKELQEQGVHIWDAWADSRGELGPVYGAQWRGWDGSDQITQLMSSLRHNPDSRRHIVSAWNVAELHLMSLVPCHMMFQFDVTDGRLSCNVTQRSADMFLGVPFNIASYAALTQMFAQQLGLRLGDLVWSGGDCHIYQNHEEQVLEQLSRKPFAFPILNLRKADSIFSYKLEDFEVLGYQHHPAIKGEVAV